MNYKYFSNILLSTIVCILAAVLLTISLTSSFFLRIDSHFQIDLIDNTGRWLLGISVVGAALLKSISLVKKLREYPYVSALINSLALLCAASILATSLYAFFGNVERGRPIMLDESTRLDRVGTVGRETFYDLTLVDLVLGHFDIDSFSARMLIRANEVLCLDPKIFELLVSGKIVSFHYRDRFGRYVSSIEVDKWSCHEYFNLRGKVWVKDVI